MSELREKIDAIFRAYVFMTSNSELSEFLDKDAMQESGVDQILAAIKEAGYVKLADDQSLPSPNYYKTVNPNQLAREKELWQCRVAGYSDAIQDMLKAGFRRVEL